LKRENYRKVVYFEDETEFGLGVKEGIKKISKRINSKILK
jgi:hypothetical protein